MTKTKKVKKVLLSLAMILTDKIQLPVIRDSSSTVNIGNIHTHILISAISVKHVKKPLILCAIYSTLDVKQVKNVSDVS